MLGQRPKWYHQPPIWALAASVVIGVAAALLDQYRPGLLPFHPAQVTGVAFLIGGLAAIAYNRARNAGRM